MIAQQSQPTDGKRTRRVIERELRAARRNREVVVSAAWKAETEKIEKLMQQLRQLEITDE